MTFPSRRHPVPAQRASSPELRRVLQRKPYDDREPREARDAGQWDSTPAPAAESTEGTSAPAASPAGPVFIPLQRRPSAYE